MTETRTRRDPPRRDVAAEMGGRGSRRERDEWRLAGKHATGLERGRLALRLSIAAANHEAAEGVGRR